VLLSLLMSIIETYRVALLGVQFLISTKNLKLYIILYFCKIYIFCYSNRAEILIVIFPYYLKKP
jgi:hypothetical protein